MLLLLQCSEWAEPRTTRELRLARGSSKEMSHTLHKKDTLMLTDVRWDIFLSRLSVNFCLKMHSSWVSMQNEAETDGLRGLSPLWTRKVLAKYLQNTCKLQVCVCHGLVWFEISGCVRGNWLNIFEFRRIGLQFSRSLRFEFAHTVWYGAN